MALVLLTILTVYLIIFDYKQGLAVSFFAGLLYDLCSINILGVTSVKLLLFALIINLYKRKFNASHFLFSLIFSMLIILITEVSLKGFSFNPAEILASFCFVVLSFIIFSKIKNAHL